MAAQNGANTAHKCPHETARGTEGSGYGNGAGAVEFRKEIAHGLNHHPHTLHTLNSLNNVDCPQGVWHSLYGVCGTSWQASFPLQLCIRGLARGAPQWAPSLARDYFPVVTPY